MTIDTVSRFSELGLAEPVLRAVEEVGYEAPSPIQAQCIPTLLAGRDLLGTAQTGTGKTAAFALPLLSRLDLSLRQPQVLVLTPTRELAIQVAEALQTYARYLKDFHILPVYGGQGMDVQLRQLRRGVHVVVGTPGRVQDHLRRGTLMLDRLAAVVLDEADEMLRMGFIEDVERILEHTPTAKQVALFSATMPDPIRRIARKHLREPVEIRIKTKTTTVTTITQRYWQVTGVHKLDALTRMLELEDFKALIIFVRTKTATLELAEKLEARGYSSAALNGDMNQALREKTIERLRSGSLDIVVATDVAARGLDVERISHVINYDIPYDTEAYVHRIGRTGRAGRKGEAILFVAPRETRMLRAIERATGQRIEPMQLPSHEAIADRRVGRFKQLITDTLEGQELGFFEQLIEDYQSEHNKGLSEIAAALAYLVQRERPLAPAKPARVKPTQAESDGAEPAHFKTGREPRAEREKVRKRGGPDASRAVEPGMIRYRIEVGRAHGVAAKNVVGAIANEAGLDSGDIGHIKFYDTYSTVDLPAGLPKPVLRHLRSVWACGQQLRLSVAHQAGDVTSRSRPEKPRKGAATRVRTKAGGNKAPGKKVAGKKAVGRKGSPKRSPGTGATKRKRTPV